MDTKISLYVFPDYRSQNQYGLSGFVMYKNKEGQYVQVTTHFSSDVEWLKHDLGYTSQRNHDLYDREFGQGNWTLVWNDIEDLQ